MSAYLAYIDAASTPLMAFLVWMVWQIKTNHLPHIEVRIARLEGRQEERDSNHE